MLQFKGHQTANMFCSYDGLIDVTHGCTGVTVSNSKLSNHYKTSLVGADDSNTEDKNTTITYANNYWVSLGSRTPSVRFGHAHVFNNYFEKVDDGINTRVGAQLLIENNVWSGKRFVFGLS
jgi:pectate lyase